MRTSYGRQPMQAQTDGLSELARGFVTTLNRHGNPGRRACNEMIGWRVGGYGSLLSPQVRVIHRPGYVLCSDRRVGPSRLPLEEWAARELHRYMTREYVEVTDGICCWQQEREIGWWAEDCPAAAERRGDDLVDWWAHAFTYQLHVLQQSWFACGSAIPPDDEVAARAWTAERGPAATRWMQHHLDGDVRGGPG